jgi:iron transport multicopper oxidase
MDGVQQITQYPILPTRTFNYTFHAASSGTYWYHSHTGGQYTDGLFGAIIVVDPEDPYKQLQEKIVFIYEWYHRTIIDTFDIFTPYYPPGSDYHPEVDFVSGLFNGKGRYNCSLLDPAENDSCLPDAPYEYIIVDYNQTYHFRLISAGSQFTYTFSIDNHNLTIVAIEGTYVQPYTVQRLVIEIGQRYDILVEMNQQPANYWVRAVTSRVFKEFNAILQYSTVLNTTEPNSTAFPTDATTLMDSKPLVPTSNNIFALRPPTFNKTLVLNIKCDDPIIDKCFVNGKQYLLPDTPTLITMFQKQVAPYNATNIIDVNYGDTVLLIVNNFINISHPMHLHGHAFYVLGAGPTSPTQIINFDIDRDGNTLNYENPAFRDTISLPQQSWLAIGFTADNPGSWLFHCHIAFDMEAGMSVIFNVNNGTIAPPPDDFPILSTFNKQVTDIIASNSTAIKRVKSRIAMVINTLIIMALSIEYL